MKHFDRFNKMTMLVRCNASGLVYYYQHDLLISDICIKSYKPHFNVVDRIPIYQVLKNVSPQSVHQCCTANQSNNSNTGLLVFHQLIQANSRLRPEQGD